jgi:regulator of sirC expression with transglutaminase-like and TPR domain
LITQLVAGHLENRARRDAWRVWPSLPTRREQLEKAFDLLAQFQYGWSPPVRVSALLDDLANEFKASGRSRDAVALNRFLFTAKRLQGCNENFYDPRNSNLIYVLEAGQGLPISLVCVFMLVGERLGIRVDGCGVPGHYLARAQVMGIDTYFDPYSEGRMLTQREVDKIRRRLSPNLTHLLNEVPTAQDIIRRVLRNLINAFEIEDEHAKSALMAELLDEVRTRE